MIIFNSQNIYSMYSGDQKKITTVYRGNKKVYPANKKTVVLKWSTSNYSKPWNDLTDIPIFSISKEDARKYINFLSTDTSIASIDSDGNINLTGTIGNCNIIASMEENREYLASSVTVNINITKADIELSWNLNSPYYIENNNNFNDLQLNNPNKVSITYSLKNNDNIQINEKGEITYQTRGKDTLTASFSGNEYYNSKKVSIIIGIYEIRTVYYTGYVNTTNLDIVDNIPGYYFKFKLYELGVPNSFLNGSNNLTSLDLSEAFFDATYIGTYFLSRCTKLKSIDLSPLSNVTSIDYGFLYDCSELQSIDLSPLSQVTTIGHYFLENCLKLTEIDLSPLSQVTTIGWCFLDDCSGLQSIDLSPLSKVTSIGPCFLNNTGIKYVDFSPLKDLTVLSGLENCSNLSKINIKGLSKVTKITSFLNGISTSNSISGLDFSELENLTEIDGLLNNSYNAGIYLIDLTKCTQLTKISRIGVGSYNAYLRIPNSIKTIGDNVLYLTPNASSGINFENLKNVTSIGNNFLSGAGFDKNFDGSYCTSLETIGNGFLSLKDNRPKFVTADLSGFYNVKTIGSSFLDLLLLRTIIIDHQEYPIIIPLQAFAKNTRPYVKSVNIYVNDELIEQYKEAVPDFADQFKPLSNIKNT